MKQKIRFGLVGIVNTLVDFSILNILMLGLHVALIPANITSTTIAMAVSFVLNRKTVFRSTDTRRGRQIVLFFIVTIAGIWLVQTFIVAGLYEWLRGVMTVPDVWLLNGAKLIAIGVGLVWNYLWYSRVVFASANKKKDAV